MRRKLFLATAILFILLLQASAQTAVVPRPSPLAIVSARYKDAYFKITYSQPHKKGRQIFGKLVPFGKVWRVGANEATELTITKNIQINGTLLLAGTYSIFAIPEKEKWTIIMNSDLGMWGSYNYNQALDVMRFDVPVQEIAGDTVFEPFTIQLVQRNEVADLLMMWDKTKVSIPVKFLN